jgi:uncharacterized membrane protein (DUF485 family)
MSGDFVQRGEPALLDKWTRTEHALRSGADLVIEIPALFCLGNAGQYADAAVRILEATGKVSHISFGSESGDADALKRIAGVLRDHDQEIEQTGDFQSGEFYFDSYQVYTADTEGNLQVIVSRPWWHWFFHYGLSLSLAFIGAAGIGITLFLSKKKVYATIRKSITFKSTKAKSIQNYFIVTTVIHVAYTLLNVICAFFTTWLIIGIIPLTLHMILSSIVLWNMIDRLRCSYDETEAVEFWGMCEIGSYIIAFLSVIIASAIAG